MKQKNLISVALVRFVILFFSILTFISLSEPISAKPKSKAPDQTKNIKKTLNVTDYRKEYEFSFDEAIIFKEEQAKIIKTRPYAGIVLNGKKVSLDRSWFELRADKIVGNFKKYYKEGETYTDFFKRVQLPDYEKIYLRAFYFDLIQNTAVVMSGKTDDLKQLISDRIIGNALIYQVKYNKQLVKIHKIIPNEIMKRMQPVMASFAYGDPFIALAEMYHSTSAYPGRARDYLRKQYIKPQIFFRLRRIHQKVYFNERKPVESIYSIDNETVAVFQKSIVSDWCIQKAYYFSPFEKKKVMGAYRE